MEFGKNRMKKWLEEYDYLQYSRFLTVNDNPLEIIIGVEDYENPKVKNKTKLNTFALKPYVIKNWDYRPTKKFYASPNTEISIVEFNEEENFIDITFCHSLKRVNLKCDKIKIEKREVILVESKIDMNQTWVNLTANKRPIPKAEFWIIELKKRGIDACFRMYGGQEKNYHEIPDDYSGFLITPKSLINETPRGIFISNVKSSDDSFFMILENQEERCYSTWKELINIFCQFENAKVMIADKFIDGKEWLERY